MSYNTVIQLYIQYTANEKWCNLQNETTPRTSFIRCYSIWWITLSHKEWCNLQNETTPQISFPIFAVSFDFENRYYSTSSDKCFFQHLPLFRILCWDWFNTHCWIVWCCISYQLLILIWFRIIYILSVPKLCPAENWLKWILIYNGLPLEWPMAARLN